ncbi:hypothetical protein DET1546 [Dehalococcoides mccartyi 195]|uniref:Uncharacterized protein n=1 Tax=Dehalococcoides mccartyi (strain ATCC BAA-2266 / KCTC 15142 / 195) TaxID=243164 RepID=Q3Z6A5_DEHM1|nr:hypothetical protein DET1546 [Dehalococcoides mccartyi 195]
MFVTGRKNLKTQKNRSQKEAGANRYIISLRTLFSIF